jgi:hypothetical protein
MLHRIDNQMSFARSTARYTSRHVPETSGLLIWVLCPALVTKIFLFSADPNHFTYLCRPAPLEGRIAIVTDAGQDAVDVDVLLTSGTEADGQVVWS